MNPDQQIKELVQSSNSIFKNIKQSYLEFLSSLKYENLSEKRERKGRLGAEERATDSKSNYEEKDLKF